VADLDFFFDPACPWAWITSRWVEEVASRREHEVTWRFISLKTLNAEAGYDGDRARLKVVHEAGMQVLRIAARARAERGNEAVASVYSAFGHAFHTRGESAGFLADPRTAGAGILSAAGLPGEWIDAISDSSYDELIDRETQTALARTGRDVGTPILTFRPGTETEASFFGPVISSIPRGEEAVRLWDAVETLAMSGVAELKRSLRAAPDFS
jgi:hypothetical protein